jgi:hypothetical protein
MAGMLRVPRSRGALSGLLLVLLGAWGGLIPFVGPYFRYAYTPDTAWTYTTGRLWLEILPAVAAVVGGLILMLAATRPTALFAAGVAALGGAWFVVGTVLNPLWATGGGGTAGMPVGGPVHHALEQIGFFQGLGAAIVFVAAIALGRLSAVTVRDARHAAAYRAEPEVVETEETAVPAPRQPA